MSLLPVDTVESVFSRTTRSPAYTIVTLSPKPGLTDIVCGPQEHDI